MSRIRNIASSFTATVLLLLSSSALATTEPMTEDELFDASDLVVDAVVVDAACAGETVEYIWGSETRYVSTVQPTDVIKGEADTAFDYRVTQVQLNEELGCSESAEALPEGWRGRLYLRRVGANFELTDWTGAMLEEDASPLSLPTCSADGETSEAPHEQPDVEFCDCATDGGCSMSRVKPTDTGSAAWLALLGLGLVAARRKK